MHKICSFFLLILLMVFVVACNPPSQPPAGAGDILPDLPGYKTIEGQSFTDALTTLGAMATLAGQPEFGTPIATVGAVVGCYQEAGAVAARVYSDESEPRNSGVVAVGDRNALSNPIIFLQCVPGAAGGIMSEEYAQATIKTCTHSYTLPRGDNEFYILYAGLTADICHDFCANLDGCTAH